MELPPVTLVIGTQQPKSGRLKIHPPGHTTQKYKKGKKKNRLKPFGIECGGSSVECSKLWFAFTARARGKLPYFGTGGYSPSPLGMRDLLVLYEIFLFSWFSKVIGDESGCSTAMSSLYEDLWPRW